MSVKCYDCKELVDDYVVEPRCTGGESHSFVPSYSYSDVNVCANRKVCIANRARRQAVRTYSRICPICGDEIKFLEATEADMLMSHLLGHDPETLAKQVIKSGFGYKTTESEYSFSNREI